jgi:hypothetical protein
LVAWQHAHAPYRPAFHKLLAACGKKPDGTPYVVNPGKLPDGRPCTAADSIAEKHRFRGNKIPKADELNAITNGARAG